MSSDLVGTWEVALSDGVHKVEFEHGTTTGKRVIRVDGKFAKQIKVSKQIEVKYTDNCSAVEIYRINYMFKLVGREHFTVSNVKCTITIDAVSGFAYEYTLDVNGKSLQKFKENQNKIMKTWVAYVQGTPTRIVLEKDTLDVWVKGTKVETMGEFVDDGTETHFQVGDNHSAYIKATTTGRKKDGIVHTLFIDDTEIPLAIE